MSNYTARKRRWSYERGTTRKCANCGFVNGALCDHGFCKYCDKCKKRGMKSMVTYLERQDFVILENIADSRKETRARIIREAIELYLYPLRVRQ